MASNIKEILHNLINPDQNWKTDLLYRWHEIIGALNSKVRIEKIYDNTLVLGVFHSCWMQELYLLSPLLIKTINEKLDHPYIKEIRFKQIGPHKQKKTKKSPIKKENENIQLTKEDERTLAKINDPTLREVLKAFRMRCYQE